MASRVEQLASDPDFLELIEVAPQEAMQIVQRLEQEIASQPSGPEAHLQNLEQRVLSGERPQVPDAPETGITGLVRSNIEMLNAPRPQAPQNTNFIGDFGAHFQNAALGYTQDDLLRKSGGGAGAFLGDVAGGFVPVGAGALGGAGLGSVVPGLGTGAGAIGGGIAGAGAAGVAQDLQMQRLEGAESPDYLRAGGAGLIQGGLQAIPILKGGSALTTIGKNMAVQGGAAGLGSVAQQTLEGREIDLRRTAAMAALGASGGGVGGIIGHQAQARIKQSHPDIAAKIEADQPLTPQEMTRVQQLLTPEESQALQQAFKERGGFTGERPQGNLDARIVDPQGRPLEAQPDRLLSAYERGLQRSQPERQTVSDVGLVTEPTPRTPQPEGLTLRTGFPELPAHLRKSAPRFGSQVLEFESDLDKALYIVGKRNSKSRSHEAFEEYLREALPDMTDEQIGRLALDVRKAVIDRAKTGSGEISDTASGFLRSQEPAAPPLRSAQEVGLQRGGTTEGLTARPRTPEEPRVITEGLTRRTEPQGLLDASGRPMEGLTRQGDGLIDPRGAPLRRAEAPAVEAPAVRPDVGGNVVKTPQGGEVFTQGGTPERAQTLGQKLHTLKEDGSGSQVVTLLEAEKLIDQKLKAGLLTAEEAQKQRDVLRLFTEAGRVGRKVSLTRRELQEGMGTISKELGKAEVKTRIDEDPFAVTITKRKASTEVGNLEKQLGSMEAVLDNLRERAFKYGLTPTTAGKTPKANARNIADQIRNHPVGGLEFTDIELRTHNFQTGGTRTETDAPRSRPLRTIESATISGNASAIPEGAQFTNQIRQANQELARLADDPALKPELQKALKDVVSGNMTKSARAKVKKLLESAPEQLQKFCKALGI